MVVLRSKRGRALALFFLLLLGVFGYGQMRASSRSRESDVAAPGATEYLMAGYAYGDLVTRLDVMLGMQRQEPHLLASEGWREALDVLWLVAGQTDEWLPAEPPSEALVDQHAAWVETAEHLENAQAFYEAAVQENNPRKLDGARTEIEQATEAVVRLKDGE